MSAVTYSYGIITTGTVVVSVAVATGFDSFTCFCLFTDFVIGV